MQFFEFWRPALKRENETKAERRCWCFRIRDDRALKTVLLSTQFGNTHDKIREPRERSTEHEPAFDGGIQAVSLGVVAGREETNVPALNDCNRSGCPKSVPLALAERHLCLDHFLDEAFVRADQAMTSCRSGQRLDPQDVDWLLSDALATVQNLQEDADQPQPEQRDRMLELILNLANLHEYAAQQPIPLKRLA